MITKNFILVILLVMAWNGAAVPASAQGTQNYAITGVHTNIGTKHQGNAIGPRPARRNIADMQNDTPTWSLYIQALIQMKSVPEETYLSWFQISGRTRVHSQI
jgi:tyrosinase